MQAVAELKLMQNELNKRLGAPWAVIIVTNYQAVGKLAFWNIKSWWSMYLYTVFFVAETTFPHFYLLKNCRLL